MLNIAVIGYGDRINAIANNLRSTGEVSLVAIADIAAEAVPKRFTQVDFKDVHFYTSAEEMLENEKLDGVLIGTRCSLHTHYACLVANYNLPLFLEKPVAITEKDLHRLESLTHMNEKTVVSFPLRLSHMCSFVKEIVDSGKLGEIAHVQAYNNVPYGRGYYHLWYRNESETGGLFLQKSTHDLDYICYLLNGLKPVRLAAMESKQVYKGDKPAGLKCADCAERETCIESDINIRKLGEGRRIGEFCCFAVDTGNHDSGSVLVEYENGLHVVYSQNFITRKGAGKRGARLIGHKGTLEFDWQNSTVTVYHHFDNTTEKHTLTDNGNHFGGDDLLCKNFLGVMKGTEKSGSPLSEGILSAKLCLAAKKSAREHVFVDIK